MDPVSMAIEMFGAESVVIIAQTAHVDADGNETGGKTIASLVDLNGPFTRGVYSDGRECRVYGRRGGFAYIAFPSDLGFVSKVPESWVSDPGLVCRDCGAQFEEGSGIEQGFVGDACNECHEGRLIRQ